MKPVNLVKRIEALEEKAAAKVPCREPKTHTVHVATRQERDATMRAMIERARRRRMFLIVSPLDELCLGMPWLNSRLSCA